MKHPTDIRNETALITGASSGIGLHSAREFASHGHSVILVAPVESELLQIAAELRNTHNVQARALAADLEDPNSAQTIFDTLANEGTHVDILVNNAGHMQKR